MGKIRELDRLGDLSVLKRLFRSYRNERRNANQPVEDHVRAGYVNIRYMITREMEV